MATAKPDESLARRRLGWDLIDQTAGLGTLQMDDEIVVPLGRPCQFVGAFRQVEFEHLGTLAAECQGSRLGSRRRRWCRRGCWRGCDRQRCSTRRLVSCADGSRAET